MKDTSKYLPAQLAPGIIGFISIPIITRIFLPEDYGNYRLVMASVMVLINLAGWLPISIIRYYPVYENKKLLDLFIKNILMLTFITISFISLFFLIFVFSIKNLISSKLYLLMLIGILVFIVMSLYYVLLHFLRSKREVNLYSGFAVWVSIISFGSGLGLIFLFKFGMEALLYGIILSVIVILPLLWKKAIGSLTNVFIKVNISLVKEIAKYSFPLVAGNLAAWILSLSDRYFLQFFRGPEEVGIYSASYNISEKSIMLINTLFFLASGPLLINIWENKGKKKSAEFLSEITRYYLIICMPIFFSMNILNELIISIMTGKQYFEGHKIIFFVTLGILFLGIQQIFQAGFLLYKKTKYITFFICLSSFLNLFLNFLFIPKYGYFGAAFTTLISYALLLLLMIFYSRRFYIWRFPFKSLIKVIFSCSIMGGVVYIVSSNLILNNLANLIFSVFLGGIIYFILLFLFNEFTPIEKKHISKLFNIVHYF
ncbi:MAG: lipopolysaccharide biosynthesis protein [Promethearchaeota archaeon]